MSKYLVSERFEERTEDMRHVLPSCAYPEGSQVPPDKILYTAALKRLPEFFSEVAPIYYVV